MSQQYIHQFNMSEEIINDRTKSHLISPQELHYKDDYLQQLTQNVLVGKDKKDEKAIIYYLPAFLRFNMKNIKSISLDDLQGSINGTLLLTVYYGQISGLGPQVLQEIVKSIVLEIDSDKSIQLKKSSEIQLKHKIKHRQFTYVIRKKITASLVGDLYWSPFESYDFIMNIKVSGFTLEHPINKTKVSIKFNLLSHQNVVSMLSATLHNTAFGHYKLAENKLEVLYTDKRQLMGAKPEKDENDWQTKNKGVNKQKHSSSYEFANFKIKVYKNPFVAGSTIFCPLWFLGIINLSIFFQDATLSNRVASIAALMIAFVALVPTIRGMIPPSPNLLFVEILVFLQLLASLLCLSQSLRISNLADWKFDYTQDALFLISLIINLFTFGSVMLLAFIHVFFWGPSYHVNHYQQYKTEFNRREWANKECENTFRQKANKHEVALFDPRNPLGLFQDSFGNNTSNLDFPEKQHKKRNLLEPLVTKVEPKLAKDKGKNKGKDQDEDEDEDDSENQD